MVPEDFGIETLVFGMEVKRSIFALQWLRYSQLICSIVTPEGND